MTHTMQATAAVKFSGPFTVRYTRDNGQAAQRSATWHALQTILPIIGRLADREKVHSIEILDRHGNDVTFSSDILPLMEDVTVTTPSAGFNPNVIKQPWGTEYACCGGEAGSGQHIGRCGA